MAQPGNDRGAMGLHSQSLSTRRLPAQRSPLSNWGTFRRDPVAVQGALDKVSSTDSGKGRHSQPEAPSESRPAPRIVRPSELGPSPLSYPPNSSRRVDSAEPSSIGPTPSNHSQAQSQYTIDPYGQLVHYPCLEAQYASGLGQGNETLSYDSLAFMAPEQRIQSMGDNLQSDPQNLSRTPQYAPLLGGFVHHYPASRPSSMAPQSHPPGMHAANGSSGSTTVSRIPYSHPQATRRASHVSDARGEQNISVSTKSSGSTPNHPTLFSAPNLALPPRFLHSDTGRQGLSLNSNLNPTSSAQRSSSAPKIPHGLPLPTYNQSTRPPYRPDGSLAQPTALPSADPNKRPRAESGARGEEKLPAAKRPRELHDPSRKGKALAEKLKSSDIPRPNTAKPTKYQLNPAALKYHMAHRDLVEDFRLSDAAPVAEYNPETIARDILLAADKHPTMGGLNSHLAPLRQHFAGWQANLDKIPWDLIDSVYSMSLKTRTDAPHAPHAPHRPPSPQPNSTMFTALNAPPPAPAPAPAPIGTLSAAPQVHPPQPTSPHSTPIPSSVRDSPVLISSASASPEPEPALQPAGASAHLSRAHPPLTPQAQSEHQEPEEQVPLNTTVQRSFSSEIPEIRHPSQSPQSKHQPTPTPQVVIETPLEMSTKRGVGRPKKAAHSETDAESPPSYPVFRCGMKDCMAELHNLSFLQTHCLKIHIPYSLTCQWEGCDDQTPRPAAAMWRHTREKHIKPIAWQLGDGPAAPSSGNDTPVSGGEARGLMSYRNVQATTMVLPADSLMVETYNRTHRIYTSQQKAEAFREGGCHWKETLGPECDFTDRRIAIPSQVYSTPMDDVAMTIQDGA